MRLAPRAELRHRQARVPPGGLAALGSFYRRHLAVPRAGAPVSAVTRTVHYDSRVATTSLPFLALSLAPGCRLSAPAEHTFPPRSLLSCLVLSCLVLSCLAFALPCLGLALPCLAMCVCVCLGCCLLCLYAIGRRPLDDAAAGRRPGRCRS